MSKESTEVVVVEASAPVAHRSFFAMEPKQQIAYASDIATVLADVIAKQKLYSNIGGKNYVKVEGWQTLGTFLGIIPKERTVIRHDDGSFEAFVDLIKFSDGTIVGGGSALCSVNEKRWGNADEYARRSMAITRATGKAFRSAFSWIVTLAGYEPTPEEEIPREEKPVSKSQGKPYTGSDEQQKALSETLAKRNVPLDKWDEIGARMKGKLAAELPKVIAEVTSGA